MDYSYLWASLGRTGRIFTPQFYWVEVPFILVMLLVFYFPHAKNKYIAFLLPVIPVIILYLMFDLFYNQMIRIPLPSDFQNFSTMFSFDPLLAFSALIVFLAIPLSLFLLLAHVYKNTDAKSFWAALLVRIIILMSIFVILRSDQFFNLHKSVFNYSVWSQEDTIKENGKFSSFIYYANQEQQNKRQLEIFKKTGQPLDIHNTLFTGEIKASKNIHLIALESFIDPRLLTQISFSHPILAKELAPYLYNQKDFSLVTSPIYGGGTAQAEFELLTGIKALSKVNQIEFNVMQGAKVSSFVNKLNQNNYQSMATIAASASFFNSKQAYKSLDFDQVIYIEEQPAFMRNNGEGPIFDGDLFDYNLSHLQKKLTTSDKPIFNYVLGMYGHMPFARDEIKRPDISEVEHSDDRVKRISNQFYYRTKAVARYIKQLIALDPESIIIISSDHLPSILGKNTVYTLDNKVNIALYIEDGKTMDISGRNLYEIPWLIWDRLTRKVHNRELANQKIEALYYTLLSESQFSNLTVSK